MSERYIESWTAQAVKSGQRVCGDHVLIDRSGTETWVVLCDGIGSGIYANVAATAAAHRLMTMLQDRVGLLKACGQVADSMHRARTEDIPYAAFTAVRFLRDGQYSAVSYDAPAPVRIRDGQALPAEQRHVTTGYELVAETTGTLKEGDALAVLSDGVTQAGTGRSHALGWGAEGVAAFLTRRIARGDGPERLPDLLLQETARLCGGTHPDDATVVLLGCRPSRVVTVLTGPPASRGNDAAFVSRFLTAEGHRVICGSSTAEMAGRVTGRAVATLRTPVSMARPPEYRLEGADLVTEGAATLNQTYNILEADPDSYDPDSAVSRLARMLRDADQVHFMVGDAPNDGHDTITFRQLGVQPRRVIVPLLARRLRAMGKRVIESHH